MPKDLDKNKSLLQTPLLPDGIMFEVTHMGHVTSMKSEDWDLADHETFPHLETGNIMKQNTMGVLIALESRKWLHGVVGSSIAAIMLQLVGLPSLLLPTWLFVTNLEAMVIYAQVLALTIGCHLTSWHKSAGSLSQLL